MQLDNVGESQHREGNVLTGRRIIGRKFDGTRERAVEFLEGGPVVEDHPDCSENGAATPVVGTRVRNNLTIVHILLSCETIINMGCRQKFVIGGIMQ